MHLGRGVANEKHRLVGLIRSRAAERIAVEQGERAIAYGELGRLIDERASALLAAGGGAGSFVAVERRKSAEFVVDYLSVLSIGGTVVPLDPDTPAERRRTFLELARPEGSESWPVAGAWSCSCWIAAWTGAAVTSLALITVVAGTASPGNAAWTLSQVWMTGWLRE
jgi:hypothetical protein